MKYCGEPCLPLLSLIWQNERENGHHIFHHKPQRNIFSVKLLLNTEVDVTITILDIIHRPVFYLIHVSETSFYLRIKVVP
jgi:hypothetical protein